MVAYTIKEFSEEDRPREKFKKLGALALSDKEILAILLRTGTKNQNVIELSDTILKDMGGITKLRDATLTELMKHRSGKGDTYSGKYRVRKKNIRDECYRCEV